MKIELLQGELPRSENPGLETTDPRFDDIVTLTQQGKHLEAAAESAAIIENGIYDIRLICYFLYGYWLEQGLVGLLDVVSCLQSLMAENWEAVGPANGLGVSLEKSLNWLLKQILKLIKYEEKKGSETWRQWEAATTAEDAAKIVEAGKSLRLSVILLLDEKAGSVIDQWSKIEQWLIEYQKQHDRTPELDMVAKEEAEEDDLTIRPSKRSSREAVQLLPRHLPKIDGVDLEVSHHFGLLLKKLAGFEDLVNQDKFLQAAMVADDIHQSLQTFDPQLYFPKIFETFVKLQAIHFSRLAEYTDHKQTMEWLALQEWCKVDIDGFIKHTIE